MKTVDLADLDGRAYPARRTTFNLVGGTSAVSNPHFSFGYVVLDVSGGQVPWHAHAQEEIYFVVEGRGQMCVGSEIREVRGGQMVHIPSNEFHQITNVGDEPLRMVYCYAPSGEVAHWRQELEGTLPRAGVEAPALPDGAAPQHTETF
jgi:mannose-6-phosphate isomerase-like protein (cupin superfamily)